MTDYSKANAIDRSHFFRHVRDYSILKAHLQKKYLDTPRAEWKALETLVVGVGHLQEPLSILATSTEAAKELGYKGVKINPSELLKLNLVDNRSVNEIEPEYSFGEGYIAGGQVVSGAFLTEEQRKVLPKSPLKPSFVSEYPSAFEVKNGECQFTEEIQKEILEAVNRGRFNTRIQDFLKENNSQYPLIFFNNILTHLGAEGEQVAYDLTTKALEHNGLVFMHHSGDVFDSKSIRGARKMILDNPKFTHLEEIGQAVYRRK